MIQFVWKVQNRQIPSWLRQWRIYLQCGRPRFNPWVRKIPWRRGWLSTPVFLPGELHGQRSLSGYRPLDHRALDTTEQLTMSLSLSFIETESTLVGRKQLKTLGFGMKVSDCQRVRSFFFPFLAGTAHMAFRTLALQPGMEPVPPAFGAPSLNHWTTREVIIVSFGDNVSV